MATFAKLFGWEGLPEKDWTDAQKKKVVSNRMDIEKELRGEIFGKASGLKEESQFELNRWVV
jgi:hypothetical protein